MQNTKPQKLILTLMIGASALAIVGLAVFFYLNDDSGNVRGQSRAHRFEELIDIVESRFIGEFDIDEFVDSAMRAAVASLDDDWSHFMTQEEYALHLESVENQFVGIGVQVLSDEETKDIRVLYVYRNSGAYDAGIRAGDIIAQVDGESVMGFTLEELRTLLQRPIDDTALISIIREGSVLEVNVVYRVVFADPVSFEMIYGNIGYVSLRNFDAGAADSFIYAVEYLMEMGAVAFIYDVRSNPGGRLNEMSAILDFLLPEGVIFISVTNQGQEHTIMSDEYYIDMPAVVLVNSNSFSAAEYFAALLSEYDYAYTVGEQTTGKSRLQSTIPLAGGGAITLSTGEYLTKNRVSLYDIGGFTPQFLIEISDDRYFFLIRNEPDSSTDHQLAKALSLLTN